MGTESYNGFIFVKSIAMFKRKICFKALEIQWSKPVPRKWRGPVIGQSVSLSNSGAPFSTRAALYSGLAGSFWIAGAEDGFYHLFLFMLFSSYCTYFVYFRCRHLCIAELYLY